MTYQYSIKKASALLKFLQAGLVIMHIFSFFIPMAQHSNKSEKYFLAGHSFRFQISVSRDTLLSIRECTELIHDIFSHLFFSLYVVFRLWLGASRIRCLGLSVSWSSDVTVCQKALNIGISTCNWKQNTLARLGKSVIYL